MNIQFLKRNKPAVLLSDKFRSMRFALRNLKNTIDEYEDQDKRAIPLIGTVSALANASDHALTNVEQKLHRSFSSDAKKHFGQAAACSLSLYGRGGSDTKPAVSQEQISLQFAGDQYFTAKRIALSCGIDNVLLHQSRFIDTWREFAPLLAETRLVDNGLENRVTENVDDSVPASRMAELPTLCARYAGLLRSHTVVVFPARHELQLSYGGDKTLTDTVDTNILVPAAIALVTAVATWCELNGIDKESDSIYENCISLVLARYSLIAEQFEGDSFHDQFAEFLADWTPRLA